MNISENGINILKQLEGVVIKNGHHIIYDDQTGKPVNIKEPLPRGATIGYGHLITQDEDFRNGISEAKATELLRADIATAECAVKNNISVPLKQNQYDALVSLAYNIGVKNFANSTVVKYINNSGYTNSRYHDLKSAWMAWNKCRGCVMAGLTQRRITEYNLFNK